MFYRIRIDLAFETLDPISDIADKAQDHIKDALTINPDDPNEELGFIIMEKCYHDENPTLPCEIIMEQYTD